MEIETGESTTYGPFIKFKAYLGTLCKLSVEWKRLKFTLHPDRFLPDYAQFSREDIAKLLPYLQSFAETGTLEPATESPLQGGSLLEESIKKTASLIRQSKDLEADLASMQEAGVSMAQNIVDQGKRIKALEEALRAWRGFGLVNDVSDSHLWADLDKRTRYLLGEEDV